MHKGNLSLEDIDEEQSQIVLKLRDVGKSKTSVEKDLF